MKIEINDHRKIFAIQEDFNKLFPNLIIEFYTKESKEGAAHPTKLVKHDKTLGECRTEHNKGTITITPGMNVVDLKENFRDIYGLATEIFKKSEKGREIAEGRHSLEEENNLIKTI